jgi:hypothetical protein
MTYEIPRAFGSIMPALRKVREERDTHCDFDVSEVKAWT